MGINLLRCPTGAHLHRRAICLDSQPAADGSAPRLLCAWLRVHLHARMLVHTSVRGPGHPVCTRAVGCCAAVRAAVRWLCRCAPISAVPSTRLIPSTAPQRCPEPRVSSLPLSALRLSRSPRIFSAHQTVNSPSYQLQGYSAAPAAASQPAAQPARAPLPPTHTHRQHRAGHRAQGHRCPPARPALTHSYAGKWQRGSGAAGQELQPGWRGGKPPRPAEEGAWFGPAQPSEQQPAPPRSPELSRDPRAAAKAGLRCREAGWGRWETFHGGTWVRGPAAHLAPLLAVPDGGVAGGGAGRSREALGAPRATCPARPCQGELPANNRSIEPPPLWKENKHPDHRKLENVSLHFIQTG